MFPINSNDQHWKFQTNHKRVSKWLKLTTEYYDILISNRQIPVSGDLIRPEFGPPHLADALILLGLVAEGNRHLRTGIWRFEIKIS